MSQILAVAVGPANVPYAFTTASGTSAQPVVPSSGVGIPILTLGSAFLNGRTFQVVLSGYCKSHGASQTMAIGLQGQVYATTFSGAQLGISAASGIMIAGNSYPFSFIFEGQAD